MQGIEGGNLHLIFCITACLIRTLLLIKSKIAVSIYIIENNGFCNHQNTIY